MHLSAVRRGCGFPHFRQIQRDGAGGAQECSVGEGRPTQDANSQEQDREHQEGAPQPPGPGAGMERVQAMSSKFGHGAHTNSRSHAGLQREGHAVQGGARPEMILSLNETQSHVM